MFLRSLTLKGFKSFADKTTLDFEPGVCVVVGPNGSGKSNIVDSVAWVLGAQGARALRGGKMDDVIFAGTAERPALGRAEVALTIDNTAGMLPIEFSEVTLTRTLFRTGESEYMINGAPCRLLDIQELLSDTGIGRQQHVIVGQGQLDAVLNARPEDRRAIIEEAAGILKFRKRREKAQRRLEATEGNLLRLTDLLREVRRQLRPLERQADAARRHDGIVLELRSITLHLAGREIDRLQSREQRRVDARRDLAREEQDLRVRLTRLDDDVIGAERALAVPGGDDVADLLARTEALRERSRGLTNLVAERRRGLERELAAVADEGVVETLVAEAARAREQLLAVDIDADMLVPLRADVEAAERRAAQLHDANEWAFAAGELPSTRLRREAETELAEAQRDVDQRDAHANAIAADLAQLQHELAQVAAELTTIEPHRADADEAERAAATLRAEVDARSSITPGLTDESRALRGAEEAVQRADADWRNAAAEASRWRARAETLALALADSGSAVDAPAFDGMIGRLSDHIDVDVDAEVAVAAALGEALHAIVIEGDAAARAAVARLKSADVSALMLVLRPIDGTPVLASVPPGARRLASCVRSTHPPLDRLLTRLLAPFVLVEQGWTAALDIGLASPDLIAVTREGDRFGGPSPWRAGPPGISAVTPAALDDATERARVAEADSEAAARSVETERQRLAAARRAELIETEADRRRSQQLEELTKRAAEMRRAVDVRAASLDERHAFLGRRVEELLADQPRDPAARQASAQRIRTAVLALDDARIAEAAAAERLAASRDEVEQGDVHAAQLRQQLEIQGAAVAERRSGLTTRLAEFEARLAARPDEEARARARRSQLEHKRDAIDALAARLSERATEAERLADRLRRRRREQSEAARAAGAKLDGLRTDRSAAEQLLAEVRERVGRLEIEEAELRLRLEQAVENVRREFDCEPDVAVSAPIPDVADGTTLSARARELERDLRLMGPINPLAVSEFDALVERHEFLQQQLDDVRNTRRELARVIKAVDEEIVNVFESAFADVARHFSELFAMLFPGGSGRVVLTDPHDLLNTGIEMEARPSGKTVRRLSLLSGGERSLTALAYLFAVFRARPSPFYLMDEVEAALDDVNLHRFLDLVHEFRDEAQLLIVSHQKRTMEAADVLYGVSMPPGGSSRVVSQRIRDLQLEEA
ncbi:MAG: chromosome segregation protein SMC [Acidimicrobiia bacterium]